MWGKSYILALNYCSAFTEIPLLVNTNVEDRGKNDRTHES